MTTKQSQPAPTPEEVWAILKETARQMKETDRRLDKKFAETDREFKEIGRMLTKAHNLFTNHWGKLMESLVEGDLVKLLNQKGINIKDTIRNRKGRMNHTAEHDSEQEMRCEIDIIATNGEEVVAVEVKTTLRVKDVDKFLGILQKFTQLLPEYSGKKVYGAVAYLQADEYSGDYAEKQGLFVVKATGSSSSIINAEGFKAKVFA